MPDRLTETELLLLYDLLAQWQAEGHAPSTNEATGKLMKSLRRKLFLWRRADPEVPDE